MHDLLLEIHQEALHCYLFGKIELNSLFLLEIFFIFSDMLSKISRIVLQSPDPWQLEPTL